MKAVLISIRPQWCEKIFNGSKTIEVRTKEPMLETPFRCYIYCTALKDKKHYTDEFDVGAGKWIGNSRVIGEFVCDRVKEYRFSNYEAQYDINDIDLTATCLNHPELIRYGKGKPICGWHITEPKLFDEPLELKYFIKGCEDMLDPRYGSYCGYCPHPCNITRPPQSWCYVEI